MMRALAVILLVASADGGVPGKAHVHVGLFEAATPSSRAFAVEVSHQAIALGGKRGLTMTQLAPDTMNDVERTRHEGALLKCLNPWSPRKEVIRCVQGLPFPPPPDPPPPGAQFVISGFVTPSDEGMVLDAMLAPMIDGEPGPPIASRSVVVPMRGKKAQRIKQFAALIAPLLDAAEGLPPKSYDVPVEKPKKKAVTEGED